MSMAKKRTLLTSHKAQQQLDDLMRKLETLYSKEVAASFIKKFDHILDLALLYPKMFKKAKSSDNNIRKGMVTKNISFYYRINKNSVRLLYLAFNKSDPKSHEI